MLFFVVVVYLENRNICTRCKIRMRELVEEELLCSRVQQSVKTTPSFK